MYMCKTIKGVKGMDFKYLIKILKFCLNYIKSNLIFFYRLNFQFVTKALYSYELITHHNPPKGNVIVRP
jgi:hypothetical protein